MSAGLQRYVLSVPDIDNGKRALWHCLSEEKKANLCRLLRLVAIRVGVQPDKWDERAQSFDEFVHDSGAIGGHASVVHLRFVFVFMFACVSVCVCVVFFLGF